MRFRLPGQDQGPTTLERGTEVRIALDGSLDLHPDGVESFVRVNVEVHKEESMRRVSCVKGFHQNSTKIDTSESM